MAPLTALHRSTLPPSGASHALSCTLTPLNHHLPASTATGQPKERLVSHLITSRRSKVEVWEVLERDAGDESSLQTARLSLLLTRRLPGTITSLSRVRTLATKRDGCDRILVGFEAAKMSLMEWSPSEHDLVPISLHTFEKLPQVAEDRPTLLAVDPASRLAAMLLPTNTGGDGTLALLPFFSEELDWEGLGFSAAAKDPQGGEASNSQGEIPYAPSHLLPLSSLTQSTSASSTAAARSSTLGTSHTGALNAFLPNASTPPIRNVISMAFLPGFTEPTLALLYAPDWTWSGRLEHLAHNYLVSLVTLSSAPSTSTSSPSASPTRATVISTSPPLPYSILSLSPCPTALGGVLLTSANGLLHLDQSGRVVALPLNRWLARDYPPGRVRPQGLDGEEGEKGALMAERLESACVEFVTHAGDDEDEGPEGGDEPTALVWCPSGTVFSISFHRTGRTLSRMEVEKIADGADVTGGGASVLRRIGGGKGTGRREGYVFIGSEQGNGGLGRWNVGGVTGSAGLVKAEPSVVAALPVEFNEQGNGMELDDDEDIYGSSSAPSAASLAPTPSASATLSSAMRNGTSSHHTRMRLEMCDTVDGFGAIRSLGMGLVDEESPAQLVAATGAGKTAGLTVFHRNLPSMTRRPLYLPASTMPAEVAEAEGFPPFVPTDGLWRFSLAPQPGKTDGEVAELWVAGGKDETMIYRSAPSGSLDLLLSLPEATLAAALLTPPSSFSTPSPALCLVHRSSICLYSLFSSASPSITPLQTLPFPHGSAHPTAHPPHASFTTTHVLLHIANGSGPRGKTKPVLYRFDGAETGLVEVALDAKENARGAVFQDDLGLAPFVRPSTAPVANGSYAAASTAPAVSGGAVAKVAALADAMDEDDDGLYGGPAAGEASAADTVSKPSELKQEAREEETGIVEPDVAEGWEWVAEVDSKGDLKIRLLPSSTEVFSSPAITLLPNVIEDTSFPSSSERSIPTNLDPDDLKLDRICFAPVGPNGQAKLHLFVLLSNGTLAVYEAFASRSAASPSLHRSAREPPADSPRLAVRFVKTLLRHLPTIPTRRKGAAASDSDLPPLKRSLIPFASIANHSGIFITGEEAVWIMKGSHGPAYATESTTKGVYALADAGPGGQKEEQVHGGQGVAEGGEFALQSRESLAISALPSRLTLSASLAYSHVPKNRRYNNLIFDMDAGLYVGSTVNDTRFVAFDEEGVPLFQDEAPGLLEPHNYRSSLEVLVPGTWQAIHGYEFRQNEFVAALKSVSLSSQSTDTGQRDFVAVGTAVYRGEDLATRGGLYVFELVRINANPSTPRQDSILRLLFFEDTKAVVNNLCDLNGYLFLSMGQKLYARAFEQDEFLLSVGFLDIGVHVTSIQAMKNFLLIGDAVQSVALIAFQEDPYKLVLLGRDYRPTCVASANFLINDGKVAFVAGDDRGVLRLFEYDPANIASQAGQRLLCRSEFFADAEATATMLFAKHVAGEDAKQNGILFGGLDGSLASLVPVRDAVARRLQAIQALLTRHVLHFGGLNPRGYRIVKNDTVSRALQKGILDGNVLAQFVYLPVDRQTELAEACGTDADTVRANLRSLRGWE
ncbi:hypothetical protein JCM11251_007584 [Rhodosporidiobolus azoricus]